MNQDDIWLAISDGLSGFIANDLVLWTSFGITLVLFAIGYDLVIGAFKRIMPGYTSDNDEDYGENDRDF